MARIQGGGVRVDGIAELHRALKRLDPELEKELKRANKSIAQFVADDARAAAYPTSMDPLSWVGGTVTIGGSQVDLDEFSLNVKNGNNVDRRKIRGNTAKKEQTTGKREGSFSLKCDFESMTQRTRAAATSRSGALAAIVGTWIGPTLLGTTIYPTYEVTIAAGRFDDWKAATADYDGIQQELSGAVTWDGTNSPVKIVYKSADVTA